MKLIPVSLRPYLCLLLLTGLLACGNDDAIDVSLQPDSTSESNTPLALHGRTYHFGFDLRSSPQEDARQYQPFLNYLSAATGYRFRLYFTAKDEDIIDKLGDGQVDFAAIGATSYLYARYAHSYQLRPIARGRNLQGRAEYRSFLVVAPNSELQELHQLAGKRMAFGSKTSTQGHLIPRIVLAQHGLELTQLAHYDYTGSHLDCVNAVVSGRADVCGMQDTMAEEMAQQGLVRILHRSDYYPSSGIVASERVDPQVIDAVRKALLDFRPQGRDAAGLYHWEKTEMPGGFLAATEADYLSLQQWMIKLGFLRQQGGQ